MRRLSQYAMKGGKQATLVAVVFAIIPVLFWISAAVVALVILRKGYQAGAQVFMWSLLPALMWWSNGDPTPALTLIGVAGLASVLRYSAHWTYVLVASMLVAIVSMPILASYLQEVMLTFAKAGIQLEATNSLPDEVTAEQVQALMEGVLGAVHLAILLACTVLARWWQSALFNPGGFQTEFHQLRLPVWLTGSLALLVFGLSNIADMTQWLFILAIPLLFAGLALVHGLVEQMKLGRMWLIATYLGLLFSSALVFTLLALLATLDSLFGLRKRLPVRVKN
ncbi:MAG: hypothetical protein HOH02_12030 [Oceanospirillaceae bacterium]|jgi:hypothetical protein|nr:hypothetical protein [Oceanospirillaceae bacterium]MBT4442765.1 hypothetical protein [Oceanospirillaceae bacterium]MBT6078674.1 hypothetical protein [Oceanospirillaceae bacterium]MBT7330005.1 hypothetical protein [Oceanospirillaceae bacterium]